MHEKIIRESQVSKGVEVVPVFESADIYSALSKIPLDIEGSNLENLGWLPSISDRVQMGDKIYNEYVEEYNDRASKVLFKNIHMHWDSCDCGGGYPCSHPNWVYEIVIGDRTIDFEDGDQLNFSDGKGLGAILPISEETTAWDFYRMCQLCRIELEFTDAAKNLFTPSPSP